MRKAGRMNFRRMLAMTLCIMMLLSEVSLPAFADEALPDGAVPAAEAVAEEAAAEETAAAETPEEKAPASEPEQEDEPPAESEPSEAEKSAPAAPEAAEDAPAAPEAEENAVPSEAAESAGTEQDPGAASEQEEGTAVPGLPQEGAENDSDGTKEAVDANSSEGEPKENTAEETAETGTSDAEESPEKEFSQTVKDSDIRFVFTADAGVLPADAQLKAEIIRDENEKEKIREAAEAALELDPDEYETVHHLIFRISGAQIGEGSVSVTVTDPALASLRKEYPGAELTVYAAMYRPEESEVSRQAEKLRSTANLSKNQTGFRIVRNGVYDLLIAVPAEEETVEDLTGDGPAGSDDITEEIQETGTEAGVVEGDDSEAAAEIIMEEIPGTVPADEEEESIPETVTEEAEEEAAEIAEEDPEEIISETVEEDAEEIPSEEPEEEEEELYVVTEGISEGTAEETPEETQEETDAESLEVETAAAGADETELTVTNESQLRSALAKDGANITLGADITVSGKSWLTVDRQITLFLNGKTLTRKMTLTQDNCLFRITQTGDLTIRGDGVLQQGSGSTPIGSLPVRGFHVDGGKLTMLGGTIRNFGADAGAGIYVLNGGRVLLSKGEDASHAPEIRDNASVGSGAGIRVSGSTLTIEAGTVSGNRVVASEYGGGIYINGSSQVDLGQGAVISGNTAYRGGGILMEGSGTLNLRGASVLNNTGTESGGGIHILSGTVNLSAGARIDGNKVPYDGSDGGGICMQGGVLNINGASVSGNVGDNNGGGMHITGNSTVSITKAEISNNSTNDNGGSGKSMGGGIYNNSELNLIAENAGDIRIKSNSAKRSGGGIFNGSKGTLNIVGAVLSGNSSGTDGGGALRNEGTATLTGVTVRDNSTTGDGGGISNTNFITFRSGDGSASVITGNSAGGSKGGGGIYNTGTVRAYGDFTVTGNSVSGSSANGGGIHAAKNSWFFTEGKPVVQENSRGEGLISNVFLATTSQKVSVTGSLATDAKIGVTSATAPTLDSPVVVSSNLNQLGYGDETNFTSDNKTCWIQLIDEEAVLVRIGVVYEKGDEGAAGESRTDYPESARYTVPAGSGSYFTAPEGKAPFVGWMVNGNGENLVQPGETLNLETSLTLTAIWMTPWRRIQHLIDTAKSGDTVTVEPDTVTAEENDVALLIPAGKKITLDLKGHTLNRNLGRATERGSAIRVAEGAELTLMDSAGGGRVTGGYTATENEGGGIAVDQGGKLILAGGAVTGNRASHARGKDIYLNDSQEITLSGARNGTITVRDLRIGKEKAVVLREAAGISTQSRIGISFDWDSDADFPKDVTDGFQGREELLQTLQSNVSEYGIGWNPNRAQNPQEAYLDTKVRIVFEEIDNMPAVTLARGSGYTIPLCLMENRPGAVDNGFWVVTGDYDLTTIYEDDPYTDDLITLTVNSDLTLTAVWEMTWAKLQAVIDRAAEAGDSSVIRLSDSLTAEFDDTALTIPAGAEITIDLNGFTLDRASYYAQEGGNVFRAEGHLILTDSAGGGLLTGGHTDEFGGGVYIAPDGHLTLNGGEISGNQATLGGGIYVSVGGRLTLNGKGTVGENYVSYTDEPNNIYLEKQGNTPNDTLIETGLDFAGGSFGVTSSLEPDEENPMVYLTKGLEFAAGTVTSFLSDNDEYAVGEGEGGEAVLGQPARILLKDSETGAYADEAVTTVLGGVYTLTAPPFTGPNGQSFAGWRRDLGDNTTGNLMSVSSRMEVDEEEITLLAVWGNGVPYIDENGSGYLCENPNYLREDAEISTDGGVDSVIPVGASGEETWYAVDRDVTLTERIKIKGDVNLILCDGATLTASKGIRLPEGQKLTVWCQSGRTGALEAAAYAFNQAGIGGDYFESAGSFVMHGGRVQATGSTNAAGIGGGYGRNAGDITIYGGSLTARGGEYGAGLGGGMSGNQSGPGGGTIVIWGGTVQAIGGYKAAGIGGGQRFVDENLAIEGGDGGLVSIWGGRVTAQGGLNGGAGIGGGEAGYGGKVFIGGSCEVEAISGDTSAQAIGHGGKPSSAGQARSGSMQEGSLNLAETCGVVAGERKADAEPMAYDNRVPGCRKPYARISADRVSAYLIGVTPSAHAEITVTDRDPADQNAEEMTTATAGEQFTVTVRADEESWLDGTEPVSVTYSYAGSTISVSPVEGSTRETRNSQNQLIQITQTYVMPRGNVTVSANPVVREYTITYPQKLKTDQGGEEKATLEILVEGKTLKPEASGDKMLVTAHKDDMVTIRIAMENDYFINAIDIRNSSDEDVPKRMGAYGDTWVFRMPGEDVTVTGSLLMGATYLDETLSRTMRKNYFLVDEARDLSSKSYNISDGKNNEYNPEDGWYYFTESITINERLNIYRPATFILKDGVTVTFKKGIYVSKSGGSLTIYAQSRYDSGNVGKLYAYDGDKTDWAAIGGENETQCGPIIINGGYIYAEATGDNGAGIGGGDGLSDDTLGKITIRNAEVHAYGAKDGAGIGSGQDGRSGDIEIFSGYVEARGGENGAGIGGGIDGYQGGTVTIRGGTVKAYGGEDAAGIGGGEDAGGGTVLITGGDVFVYGGENGAGIGGGDYGSAGTVTIRGGNVYVKGGKYGGAGIGAGKHASAGTVMIDGGRVEVEATDGAAAIGGASDTAGGKCTINGGTLLLTTTGGGACIGGGSGNKGGVTEINGGTIYFDASANMQGVGRITIGGGTGTGSASQGSTDIYRGASISWSQSGSWINALKDGKESTLKTKTLTGDERVNYKGAGYQHVRIAPCTHPVREQYRDETDEQHSFRCVACEEGIKGTVYRENHVYESADPALCVRCGHRRDHSFTFVTEPEGAGVLQALDPKDSGRVLSAQIEGELFHLKIAPAEGYELESFEVRWKDKKQKEYTLSERNTVQTEDGELPLWQFTMPKGDVTVTAVFRLKDFTVYLDNQHDENNRTQGTATVQPRAASMGTSVQVNVIPHEDHRIREITVFRRDAEGRDTGESIASGSTSPCRFTMPASDVNVHVSYRKIGRARVFAVLETLDQNWSADSPVWSEPYDLETEAKADYDVVPLSELNIPADGENPDLFQASGYAFDDPEGTRRTVSEGTRIILEEGCSALYIFYTRKTYALSFHEDIAGEGDVLLQERLPCGYPIRAAAERATAAMNTSIPDGYSMAGWSLNPKTDGPYSHLATVTTNAEYAVEDLTGATMPAEDMEYYPVLIRHRVAVRLDPGAYDHYAAEDPSVLGSYWDGAPSYTDTATQVWLSPYQIRSFMASNGEKIAMDGSRNDIPEGYTEPTGMNDAFRDGYELEGWYTSGGIKWEADWGVSPVYCDQDANGQPLLQTMNEPDGRGCYRYYTITLTARWKLRKAEVVFDLDGGTWNDTVDPGSRLLTARDSQWAVRISEKPVREGYSFYRFEDQNGKLYTANKIIFYLALFVTYNDMSIVTTPGTGAYSTASGTPVGENNQIVLKARYTKLPEYTLIFDPQGGSAAESLTQYSNQVFTAEQIYQRESAREGYTFLGWSASAEESAEIIDRESGSVRVTETNRTKTLYARWKVNQYTVSFDTDGGSEIPPITQDYGTAIEKPEDPIRDEYVFIGWSPAIPETMPAKNLTVKANWKVREPDRYTLIFDTDGGSGIEPVTLEEGSSVTAPEAPEKEGYTFDGWDPEIPEIMPGNDLTVKAQWRINQYTITFDTDGGSEIGPITRDYGAAVAAPANPEKTGHTFAGWNREIPATMPADNLTVKALWQINQYTITFNTDGGSAVDPITGDYNTPVTAPADPEKEGYTFQGWEPELPAAMPAENRTLKAVWKINSSTITFDTAGGTAVPPVTQDYGTAVAAPADPTRTGYTFTGWVPAVPATMPAKDLTVQAQWQVNQYTITFDTDGGTEFLPVTQDYATPVAKPDDPQWEGWTFTGWDREIPETMPAENLTVTALWKINQYKITYDTNGGSAIDALTQDYNSFIIPPENPTRDGYVFAGWKPDIPPTMPAEDITVTAQWTEKKPEQHTITFDTDGGSVIAPLLLAEGEAVPVIPDPDKPGYTFVDWEPDIPKTMPAEDLTVRALWQINQYTITFDTAGGSPVRPVTQDYDTEVTAPEAPVKEGYTFRKWDPALPARMPAENRTVKAVWQINSYTLTFDTDGGTPVRAITGDYGAAIDLPANPTRTGYTFLGWDREIPVTMPAENLTFKALWQINQYTITFNTDGGTEIPPITADYSAAVTAPADPEKEGCSFTGWNRAIPAAMPAENITVTALWQISRYTLTFDTAGGSAIAPLTLDYRADITPPANPTREGFVFAGWKPEIPAAMPAKDLTVTAQWTVKETHLYTLTFDTDGGSVIPPMALEEGSPVTAPADPARTGHTFAGWEPTLPETMPGNDLTVRARWNVNPYQITFITGGGTAVDAIRQNYGTEVTAPAAPQKKGYTFLGWNPALPAVMPAENLTVTAQWQINRYTMTFDTDGGTPVSAITQDYDTVITVPANPTKTGYTFLGWSPSIPAKMPAADWTMTARWKVSQYTLTFDTDGGTEIASVTQNYGTEVTAPADPVKTGYTFAGWDREVPAAMPAEDLTLRARWNINRYRIVFNTDGGSAIDPIQQNYGTDITPPENPTREGFVFTGWQPAIPAVMPAKDLTVTAQWKEKEARQFTLTFDTNGGSVLPSRTLREGTRIARPADPVRTGHTFVKWNPDIPATMPGEDLTVRAEWSVNDYTLTFDTDGGSEIPAVTQAYGTAVSEPGAPVREGYSFRGWSPALPETMPAENRTVKAVWQINRYTITFDTDGGSGINALSQDYGAAITAPADPARTGFAFAGWDPEIPETMPANDLTVRAQWKLNQYTLTFDTDGGTRIDPITADYLAAVTAPADPEKEGYTFTGWNRIIPETMPAENLTFRALWTVNQYRITFNTDGGTPVDPIIQDYGTPVIPPANPQKTDFQFAGWDRTIPATMPAENLTITAKWAETEKTIRVIYFETFGDREIEPIYTEKASVSLREIQEHAGELTRTGYLFAGWGTETEPVTNPDGTDGLHGKNPVGETLEFGELSSVTLYAIWDVLEFTVTFDVNGGETELKDAVYPYGAAVAELKDYQKDVTTRENGHYVFQGWNPGLPETMPAENLKVTAAWRPAGPFTVTFDFMGGASGDGETEKIYDNVYFGTSVEVPSGITRKNHVLKGWAETEKGTPEKLPEYLAVNEPKDMTRYAIWYEIQSVTAPEIREVTAHTIEVAVPSVYDGEEYSLDGGAWVKPQDGRVVFTGLEAASRHTVSVYKPGAEPTETALGKEASARLSVTATTAKEEQAAPNAPRMIPGIGSMGISTLADAEYRLSGKDGEWTEPEIWISVGTDGEPAFRDAEGKPVDGDPAGLPYTVRNEGGTLTFTGLEKDCLYAAQARYMETETQLISAPSETSTAYTLTEKLTGVSISGQTLPGQTLRAGITPAALQQGVTVRWYRGDGITPIATGLTCMLTEDDLGQIIRAEAEQSFRSGEESIIRTAQAGPVAKAPNPRVPDAVQALTDLHSLTVTAPVTGSEGVYEYSRDLVSWQKSTVFDGLEEETEYPLYARFAETETTAASGPSPERLFTTEKTRMESLSLEGEPFYGRMLTASYEPEEAKDVTMLWFRDDEPILTEEGQQIQVSGSTYIAGVADIGHVISVRAVQTRRNGGDIELTDTSETIRKLPGTAPKEIIAEAAEDSLNITDVVYDGDKYPELQFEYSRDGKEWQDSSLFEGLEQGTEYTLYARTKETATHEASEPVSGRFTTAKTVADLYIVLQNTDGSWTEPGTATGQITGSYQAEDRPGFSVTGCSLDAFEADEGRRGAAASGDTIRLPVGTRKLYLYRSRKAYTLTFHADSAGNNVAARHEVLYEAPVADLAPALSPDGFTMAGWATEPAAEGGFDPDSVSEIRTDLTGMTMPAANLSLYPILLRNRVAVHLDVGAVDANANETNMNGWVNPVSYTDETTQARMSADQLRSFTMDLGGQVDPDGHLQDTTRDGYTLDGWYTSGNVRWAPNMVPTPEYCDRDQNGEPVRTLPDEETPFTTYTMTLTARWLLRDAEISYSYAENGALPDETGEIPSQILALNQSAQITDVVPVSLNQDVPMEFAGWEDREGNLYTAGMELTYQSLSQVTEPGTGKDQPNRIELKAVFREIPTGDGIVRFHSMGGSAMNPYSVEDIPEGRSVTLALAEITQNPTRTGFDFAGWLDAEANGNPVETVTVTKGQTVDVYAGWTPKKYRIILKTENGTLPQDAFGGDVRITKRDDGRWEAEFAYGASVPQDAAASPDDSHYLFDSWNPALPAVMPAEDVSTEAVWRPIWYQMDFVYEETEGSQPVPFASALAQYGQAINNPGTPSHTQDDPFIDYRFMGWRLNGEGAVVSFPVYMPDSKPMFASELDRPYYEAWWMKVYPAPAAPDVEDATATTIRIRELTEVPAKLEYSIDNGATWQSGTVFSGLQPDTDYQIIARYAATDESLASEVSEPTDAWTMKQEQELQEEPAETPELVVITGTTVTIQAREGEEYSIDDGKTWRESGEFSGLKPGTDYRIVARKKNAETEAGGAVSEPLEIRTLEAGDISLKLARGTNTPKVSMKGLPKETVLKIAALQVEDAAARQQDGEAVVVTVEVRNIDATVSETDKQLARNALTRQAANAKADQYLDISVYVQVGQAERQKISDLGDTSIELTLTVPEQFKAPDGTDRTYYVVRIHGEGTARKAEVLTSGKSITLSFSSAKFTPYVLGESDAATPTNATPTTAAPTARPTTAPQQTSAVVRTADDSNMPLWIGLLGLLIAAMIGFNVYQNRKKRK